MEDHDKIRHGRDIIHSLEVTTNYARSNSRAQGWAK